MDDMARPPKAPFDHPIPVLRAVRELGADIRRARLRRRISTKLMSERASISRTTLNKVERGDVGVAMGNYAKVLFVLGLGNALEELVANRNDALGLELQDEQLPRRIRHRR